MSTEPLEGRLRSCALQVRPLDQRAMAVMRLHLDSLTKPLGSLGSLEDLAVQLSGIYRTPKLPEGRKVVIVMAADNGVCEEGVSSCPQSVTASVTENFMKGFTGINVFLRFAGAYLTVVDIGVASDLVEEGIHNRKLLYGTGNIAKGPAMTREQCLLAVLTGVDMAEAEVRAGATVLGTGEMGIGNTTTSAAVLSVLSGYGPHEVTGRGSGLSDAAYGAKVDVVRRALEVNAPDSSDVIDVVSKVGGLDIAGLMGVFIGGALAGVPVLIDGFISGVAALAATAYCPSVRPYLVASHLSAEPGTARLFEQLGMDAPLRLGMRLGEGTGAALAFTLIDLVRKVVHEMGTFGDAGIDQYVPQA